MPWVVRESGCTRSTKPCLADVLERYRERSGRGGRHADRPSHRRKGILLAEFEVTPDVLIPGLGKFGRTPSGSAESRRAGTARPPLKNVAGTEVGPVQGRAPRGGRARARPRKRRPARGARRAVQARSGGGGRSGRKPHRILDLGPAAGASRSCWPKFAGRRTVCQRYFEAAVNARRTPRHGVAELEFRVGDLFAFGKRREGPLEANVSLQRRGQRTTPGRHAPALLPRAPALLCST